MRKNNRCEALTTFAMQKICEEKFIGTEIIRPTCIAIYMSAFFCAKNHKNSTQEQMRKIIVKQAKYALLTKRRFTQQAELSLITQAKWSEALTTFAAEKIWEKKLSELAGC